MLTEVQVCLTLHADSWLAALNLENFCWHVPVDSRYCFLVLQVNQQILQFMLLPFELSITPQVFTKLTKPVAQKLS